MRGTRNAETVLLLRGKVKRRTLLLMDRAYEGNEIRQLAVKLGYVPVVPPKSNRKEPWQKLGLHIEEEYAILSKALLA